MKKLVIMEKNEITKTITSLAKMVLEKNKNVSELAIIGIKERGDVLAKRLVKKIKSLTDVNLPLGILDITFYRDDLGLNPQKLLVHKTDINFDVTGKIIILVDDVLFTGRSARAALDAIIDFGRPKQIQLLVLVDRGLREFPIHADFVGKTIETTLEDKVSVKFKDSDEEEEVVLIKKV